MSWGGGGGSGGTNAHTHNAGLSNDGGALSSVLTQIDTGLLQNNIRVNALVFG
tara:strand:- start:227 stop:385 length:159 start_codon:yes stop_codon:yes gene_type:complete